MEDPDLLGLMQRFAAASEERERMREQLWQLRNRLSLSSPESRQFRATPNPVSRQSLIAPVAKAQGDRNLGRENERERAKMKTFLVEAEDDNEMLREQVRELGQRLKTVSALENELKEMRKIARHRDSTTEKMQKTAEENINAQRMIQARAQQVRELLEKLERTERRAADLAESSHAEHFMPLQQSSSGRGCKNREHTAVHLKPQALNRRILERGEKSWNLKKLSQTFEDLSWSGHEKKRVADVQALGPWSLVTGLTSRALAASSLSAPTSDPAMVWFQDKPARRHLSPSQSSHSTDVLSSLQDIISGVGHAISSSATKAIPSNWTSSFKLQLDSAPNDEEKQRAQKEEWKRRRTAGVQRASLEHGRDDSPVVIAVVEPILHSFGQQRAM
eukprot:2503165-Rhodomonas_salina.2